ncbi:MAG: hypothetical protein E6265_01980 [Enterobacteriaceae bacterium]|nr:hypothetical protein [Enterobacteriaceae bacterium]
MAKPDWGALQDQFLAEHAKSGISPKDWCEAQGLNYASAKRYIKVTNYGANSQKSSAKKTANSQKGKSDASKTGKREKNPRDTGSTEISPQTKPIRGSRHAPPIKPFQPGNQHALKHGGYGRRMLLSDAITEDAQMLTLDDELFWLRAANLTAAENIGRWKEEAEGLTTDEAKDLHNLISAAEKAMHRNTARIESLEYTKGNIVKMQVEAAYREAATEKVELEIGVMKDGDKDNAVVVHNALPIPGR